MSTANLISVMCTCGKRLKAPETAAGKKARCPACGAVNVLPRAEESAYAQPPVPVRRAVPPPPVEMDAPAEEDDLLGAMYEMAHQETVAPARSNEVYCPQCQNQMMPGAVLCIQCGYDTRTGKSAATAAKPVIGYASTKAGKKAGKAVDLMAPTGSLLMGVVLSAVLALAASVVWIGVAWATGYSIAYVAILIGGAAGVGMQIGHKGHSNTGGFIAGTMTLAAILVAKAVVAELTLARLGIAKSLFALDGSKLLWYFFSPIGCIIMAVGVGFAFRTASGSTSD